MASRSTSKPSIEPSIEHPDWQLKAIDQPDEWFALNAIGKLVAAVTSVDWRLVRLPNAIRRFEACQAHSNPNLAAADTQPTHTFWRASGMQKCVWERARLNGAFVCHTVRLPWTAPVPIWSVRVCVLRCARCVLFGVFFRVFTSCVLFGVSSYALFALRCIRIWKYSNTFICFPVSCSSWLFSIPLAVFCACSPGSTSVYTFGLLAWFVCHSAWSRGLAEVQAIRSTTFRALKLRFCQRVLLAIWSKFAKSRSSSKQFEEWRSPVEVSGCAIDALVPEPSRWVFGNAKQPQQVSPGRQTSASNGRRACSRTSPNNGGTSKCDFNEPAD